MLVLLVAISMLLNPIPAAKAKKKAADLPKYTVSKYKKTAKNPVATKKAPPPTKKPETKPVEAVPTTPTPAAQPAIPTNPEEDLEKLRKEVIGEDKKPRPLPIPSLKKDKDTTILKEVVETVDENSDGIIDIKKYFIINQTGEKILVRKELDLNGDGKVDYIYYYENQKPIDDKVSKIIVDNDFDGKFDEVRYYSTETGQILKKELDLNFDGRPEIIKRYYNGLISKKEADTNSDGIIDYWEYYQDGKLARTEVDTDGDGKPDKIGKTQIQEVYKFEIEDVERPRKAVVIREEEIKKAKAPVKKKILKKKHKKTKVNTKLH